MCSLHLTAPTQGVREAATKVKNRCRYKYRRDGRCIRKARKTHFYTSHDFGTRLRTEAAGRHQANASPLADRISQGCSLKYGNPWTHRWTHRSKRFDCQPSRFLNPHQTYLEQDLAVVAHAMDDATPVPLVPVSIGKVLPHALAQSGMERPREHYAAAVVRTQEIHLTM